MTKELRIGTSGYVYPHWKGIYYPEDLSQKDWFGFYARDFDTVEINNTFYNLPQEKTFEHWGEVAPRGFIYTFKANRYITHIKRLKDPDRTLQKFVDRIRLAGKSMGPSLYQLPPRWRADPQRLEDFLKALPGDIVNVLEFRDDRWHTEETRDLLARYNVSFCIHDHGHVSNCPDWVTADTVYLRFHGSREAPYSGSYSDEFLQEVAKKIVRWQKEEKTIYAYFNNDIGGHAFRNALTLKKMLS